MCSWGFVIVYNLMLLLDCYSDWLGRYRGRILLYSGRNFLGFFIIYFFAGSEYGLIRTKPCSANTIVIKEIKDGMFKPMRNFKIRLWNTCVQGSMYVVIIIIKFGNLNCMEYIA